jgi:hypothetical protein
VWQIPARASHWLAAERSLFPEIVGPAKLATSGQWTSGQWRSHGHGVLFLSLVLLALLLAAFIYQIVTTP